jgi:rhodanese-related sulfurtransferase
MQTPPENSPSSAWEVEPADLPALREQYPDLLLLDCRTPGECREDRLDGAEFVPMQEVSVRLGELDHWRERVVVVYCRSGRRSMIVARYLSQRGFTCVRSLAGGILRVRDCEQNGTAC